MKNTSQNSKEGLLTGAEPLYLSGNKVGFLFVHGFTASPYEGKEIGERLHAEFGVTVSIPLLPGHGTRPEELINIRWLDWYLKVREEYYQLKGVCEKIFVCGQSMGAALSLHLAAHHSVAGVITLAGAVFLKDWRLKLLPLARHLLTYQYKSKGPDIRNAELKETIPNYRKYPIRSVYELLNLLRHTKEDLPEVTAPALLIHSQKDRTVHISNLEYIYRHISSSEKRKVILEQSYHLISIDVEKEKVYQEIRSFVERHR